MLAAQVKAMQAQAANMGGQAVPLNDDAIGKAVVNFAKESAKSSKKIDAAICVVGARMVRRLVLAERARNPKDDRSRRLVRR